MGARDGGRRRLARDEGGHHYLTLRYTSDETRGGIFKIIFYISLDRRELPICELDVHISSSETEILPRLVKIAKRVKPPTSLTPQATPVLLT